MNKMTSTPPRSPRTPPPTPPLRSSSLCSNVMGSGRRYNDSDVRRELKNKLRLMELAYPEVYYRQLERAYHEMVEEVKRNAEQSPFAMVRKLRDYLEMALEHPDSIPQIIESMQQWNPMVQDCCDSMRSRQLCESGQSCECSGQPSV
jgi:hypothetical protein